jgi:hypothetical protein
MTKKIIAIVVLVILLFILVRFGGEMNNGGSNIVEVVQEEQSNEIMEIFDIKHQYKEGKHTFVGSIELPTPCYVLDAKVEEFMKELESTNERSIKINFHENLEGEGVCAQTIDIRPFRIEYLGKEDLKFRIFVNNKEFQLNIFEVPEHVDIDQFEIYLKG